MLKSIFSFLLVFCFAANALAVPEVLVSPVHESSHQNCCCGSSDICRCVHAMQKVFDEITESDMEAVSLKSAGCGLSDEAVKILLMARDYYFYENQIRLFIPQLNNAVPISFHFSISLFDQTIDLPPKLA